VISALLTARKGSTLADKNILPVFNKPLLSYPAEAARRSRYIQSFYVSSDDSKILNCASRFGYERIIRPKSLSRKESKHGDVLKHALKTIRAKERYMPDILVVLLANSVSIRREWIDRCIKEILIREDISAVIPVCLDLDHHPFRAKRLNKRGFLEPFFDFGRRKISTNRQQLCPAYFPCHNFWVLNVKKSIFKRNGQQPWDFMGNAIKPFIVNDCCDVHTKKDLIRSEVWLKENLHL